MPKTPLQGISLTQLADGYAGRAIDAGIAEVSKDIDERGRDGQKRKLVLTLTFTPESNGHVEVDVQVSTKLPAFRPPTTKAKYDGAAGGLVFDPDCRDNPAQKTFADAPDQDGPESDE